MLSTTSNLELPTTAMGRSEKERNKQNAKAMTFHFELDQTARTRSSRSSSIVAVSGDDHQMFLSNTINQVSNPDEYDDINMPQRKQQQRRASAKYYIKNKEAIKEKRRMRYWVGVLTKIAERNNSETEEDDKLRQEMSERDEEFGGSGNQMALKSNNSKEAVFIMESGQPRQKGRQITDDHSPRQSPEQSTHHPHQEHPSSSNSSAVLFHEQLNAIISDNKMMKRDDLVLGLKPVLEAMLTKMIELEQQQHQQQTF